MTLSIDLFLWPAPLPERTLWTHGNTTTLSDDVAEASAALWKPAQGSTAEFVLLWREGAALPEARVLAAIIESGVDVAHAGLKQNLGRAWPNLNLLMQDWSMINAPRDHVSTSWRLGLDACLIRRAALLKCGGIDAAFETRTGAGLELGFRLLKLGALIEHRPELEAPARCGNASTRDFYLFLLRHYGKRWAQYALSRRAIGRLAPRAELTALRAAQAASTREEATHGEVMWFPRAPRFEVKNANVSVIIPTLGRYLFLPGALESLQRQSVRPREVVVVDQNPEAEREPQVYEGYDDLNLRVIYQDERGQSLARNGGLESVSGEWVLLFDDDSVAHDNLIEAHLNALCDGRFDTSTGVSLPPQESPESEYQLPLQFRHARLAQTFDTGNSFLRTETARALGGLDRNYDFGPATDLDFGTRLYQSGARIAHNPQAARIHFKAPMGGLRVHGALKYNTDSGMLNPFPPVTLSYYGLRFLTRKQRRERLLLSFATAKMTGPLRRGNTGAKARAMGGMFMMLALLPVKQWRSQRQARVLLQRGPQLLPASTRKSHDTQIEPK